MERLTQQQMLDRAWKHFVVDHAPKSVLGNGACAYRGNAVVGYNGTPKCAIGLFIPDEEYKYGMEGQSVFSLERSSPNLTELFPERSEIFLFEFQMCHDNTSFLEFHEQIEQKFRDLAAPYNLKVPE